MSPLLLPLLLWSGPAQAQDAPTLGPALPPAPVLPATVSEVPVDAVFGPEPPASVLDALPQTETAKPAPSLDTWLSDTEQSPETPSPFSWWLAPLGLIGVGVLVWSRKRMGKPLLADQESAMTVLSKQVLTPQASLVLLEVQTQDGESRRLLVGVGEKGPVLVSDLGGSIPGFIMPGLDHASAAEVTIEDSEDLARAPIQDRVPRAPRPAATVSAPKREVSSADTHHPPQREAQVHTLPSVPRRVANKGLVGRFTQADLAPADEPERTPPVQAWSKAPSAPRQAPPPRLRHEVEKQEFLSTRDLVAPIQANARRL